VAEDILALLHNRAFRGC